MNFSELGSIGAGPARDIGDALDPLAAAAPAADEQPEGGDTFAALLGLLVAPPPAALPLPVVAVAETGAARGGAAPVAVPVAAEISLADLVAPAAAMPATAPVPDAPAEQPAALTDLPALEPHAEMAVPDAAPPTVMRQPIAAMTAAAVTGAPDAPPPPATTPVPAATPELPPTIAGRPLTPPAATGPTLKVDTPDAPAQADAPDAAVAADGPPTAPAPRADGVLRPPVPIEARAVVADVPPASAQEPVATSVAAAPAPAMQGESGGRSFEHDESSRQPAAQQPVSIQATARSAGDGVIAFPDLMPRPMPLESATPMAAIEQAAAEPIELPDLTPQIAASVRLQVAGEIGHARVQLRPDHLGEVIVDLRVEQGDVIAAVRADRPEVREWIQARSEELRSALGAHGLELVHVSVNERERRQSRDQNEERKVKGQRSKVKGESRVFELAA